GRPGDQRGLQHALPGGSAARLAGLARRASEVRVSRPRARLRGTAARRAQALYRRPITARRVARAASRRAALVRVGRAPAGAGAGESGGMDPTLRVFELPGSTALIVTLMLSDWVYVRQPMIALNLIGLALVLPILRILRQVTLPAPSAALWCAAGLIVLNRLRDLTLLSAPVVEQEVVLLVSGGGAVAMALLWRRDLLSVGRFKLPGVLAGVGTGVLVLGCLLAALGYMRLARLLTGGVLRSVYAALGLFAGLVVTMAVFSYLLRVPPVSRLPMVPSYRALIERRFAVLLCCGALLILPPP